MSQLYLAFTLRKRELRRLVAETHNAVSPALFLNAGSVFSKLSIFLLSLPRSSSTACRMGGGGIS